MVPTQTAVCIKSAAEGKGWNIPMWERERLVRFRGTADGTGVWRGADDTYRHWHHRLARPGRETIERRFDTLATDYTPMSAVSVHADARLYVSVGKRVAAPIKTEFADIDANPNQYKQLRQLETFLPQARAIGMTIAAGTPVIRQNAAARVVDLFTNSREKNSYVRFFTCAWLDYLGSMAHIAANPAAPHVKNWAAAGNAAFTGNIVGNTMLAHAGPRTPIVGAVPAFGNEDDIWNFLLQIDQGERFLYNMEGGYNADQARWVVRWGNSWPATRPQIVDGAGNIQSMPQAYHYNIPGATHIVLHVGTDVRAAAGDYPAPAAVDPDPASVLAAIMMAVRHTGRPDDCTVAFEIASSLAFGVHNGRRDAHNAAVSVDRTVTGRWHENRIALPRDQTLGAYFMPLFDDVQCDAKHLQLFARSNEELRGAAAVLGLQCHIASQWAFKALSLTGACFAARNDANPRGAHWRKVCTTASNTTLSILDATFRNCVAHMYGWWPTRALCRLIPWSSPGGAGYQHQSHFAENTHPFLTLPFFLGWSTVMIPDFMCLPWDTAVVKWPDNKPFPMYNAMDAPREARVGWTLAPDPLQPWLGDGGSEYSLQFYTASNYGQGLRSLGANDNIQFRIWDKPNEHTLPVAAAPIVVDRMPGIMSDFIWPGSISTYHFARHSTQALGVRSTFVGPANVAWSQIIRKIPGSSPYILPFGDIVRPTDEPGMESYFLVSLRDSTGAYCGMSIVSSAGDIGPRTMGNNNVGRLSAGSQASDFRGVSGPAALANPNNLHLPNAGITHGRSVAPMSAVGYKAPTHRTPVPQPVKSLTNAIKSNGRTNPLSSRPVLKSNNMHDLADFSSVGTVATSKPVRQGRDNITITTTVQPHKQRDVEPGIAGQLLNTTRHVSVQPPNAYTGLTSPSITVTPSTKRPIPPPLSTYGLSSDDTHKTAQSVLSDRVSTAVPPTKRMTSYDDVPTLNKSESKEVAAITKTITPSDGASDAFQMSAVDVTGTLDTFVTGVAGDGGYAQLPVMQMARNGSDLFDNDGDF
jgi:hypothetical protein